MDSDCGAALSARAFSRQQLYLRRAIRIGGWSNDRTVMIAIKKTSFDTE